MSSNFLSLRSNPSKTEFLILVNHNNSLNSIILPFIYLTMSYSRLLILLTMFGFIIDKNLSFAQRISAVSKSGFHNIRDSKRIRNTID